MKAENVGDLGGVSSRKRDASRAGQGRVHDGAQVNRVGEKSRWS